MTGLESLLCSVLNCGSLDLSILDDTEYDLGDIVTDLEDIGVKPTLNAITGEIFRKGQQDLKEKLEERISNMKSERDEFDERTEEYQRVQRQIDDLEILDPDNDIDWFCNCLDTSIWFSDNEEIYRKYLTDEIKDVEYDMGFEF